MHLKKTFLKTSLKTLLGIFFAGFILSCSDSGNNLLDKQLKTGESYFSIVYNKDFSERFKLKSDDAIELDQGVQAVAIEIRQMNFKYQCLLHFYVDDTVDIYMLNDGSYFYNMPESEYFYGNGLNETDQEWNSGILDLNIMKIIFIKNDFEVPGNSWIHSMYYHKVHRSFLPDLSVASIMFFCEHLTSKYSPAIVRIQKKSVKNYLTANEDYINPKHKENFYEFAIPEKLIDNAAPYVTIAVKKVIESYDD